MLHGGDMQSGQGKPADFDSADLDAIRELVRSPGYALVVKRIDETLARKRLDLEGTGKVARLRGEIAGLLVALAIPGYLMQEFKESIDGSN